MYKSKSFRSHLFMLVMLLLFASSCVEGKPIDSSAQPLSPQGFSTSTPKLEAISPTQSNNICWETRSSSATSTSESGSVLYYSPEYKHIIAYDVNSHHYRDIINASAEISVSLNGNKIAYYNPSTGEVRVLSDSNAQKLEVPKDLYLDGFFSDDNLRLGVPKTLEQNYQKNVGTKDQYYLLEPDTSNLRSNSISLPYFKYVQNSFAKYSPNLRYVVYSSFYQEDLGAILLDVNSSKVIWSGWKEGFPTGNFPSYPQPLWKPDSSAFTLVMLDQEKSIKNVFNISTNGQVSQLTHFENTYKLPNEIGYLTWSPNGRYLALRLDFDRDQVDPSQNNLLIVVDTLSGKTINTCLSLGRDINHPIGYPVWSPSGDQLAVVPADRSGIYILDLESQSIHKLLESSNFLSANLLGWVNWKVP